MAAACNLRVAARARLSAEMPQLRLLVPLACASPAGIGDGGVGAARAGWRRQWTAGARRHCRPCTVAAACNLRVAAGASFSAEMPQLRLLASLACASSTGIGDEGTGRLETGGRGAAVMPTLHGGGCLLRAALSGQASSFVAVSHLYHEQRQLERLRTASFERD